MAKTLEMIVIACLLAGLVDSTPLTSQERQQILQLINNRRANLPGTTRSGASLPKPYQPLPALVWDDSIATLSEMVSSSCVYGHVTQTYQGKTLGQSIFKCNTKGCLYISNEGMKTVVEQWYDEEIGHYTWNPLTQNDCSSADACGHFIQMIWGKTTKIGCSKVECSDKDMVVCDFEGIPIKNEYPYATSAPTTRAPTTTPPPPATTISPLTTNGGLSPTKQWKYLTNEGVGGEAFVQLLASLSAQKQCSKCLEACPYPGYAGHCVTSNKVCDGFQDCADAADELGCGPNHIFSKLVVWCPILA